MASSTFASDLALGLARGPRLSAALGDRRCGTARPPLRRSRSRWRARVRPSRSREPSRSTGSCFRTSSPGWSRGGADPKPLRAADGRGRLRGFLSHLSWSSVALPYAIDVRTRSVWRPRSAAGVVPARVPGVPERPSGALVRAGARGSCVLHCQWASSSSDAARGRGPTTCSGSSPSRMPHWRSRGPARHAERARPGRHRRARCPPAGAGGRCGARSRCWSTPSRSAW